MLRLALLLTVLAASCAQAQEVALDTSDAVRCLSPAADARGAPEYPFDEYKAGKTGRVKVRLTFIAPDRAPALEVLEKEGGSEFVDAVKQHVRQFRVPCLSAATTPARLVQEYVFRPDQRQVFWSHDEDLDDVQRSQTYLANAVGEIDTRDPARRAFLDWLAAAELRLSESALDAAFADRLTVHIPCLKIDLKPKEKP